MNNIFDNEEITRKLKELEDLKIKVEKLLSLSESGEDVKLEIEQIRGVNCDYTIQKLLEKELISISGKAETIGKPLLYTTSGLFMDYFGINSTNDLPQINELITENNTIGEQAE